MMDQAIKNFAQQFKYQPKIENAKRLKARKKFVVCGMGGSGLTARLLQIIKPELDLLAHRDYGLPAGDLSGRLIIFNSYSGNTEEVIDGFNQALQRKLPLLVIATGGKLIRLAQENNIPYIQMPNTGIQPRLGLGLGLLALLKATGQSALLEQTSQLANVLRPDELAERGQVLAKKFSGQVPIIYGSTRNLAVVYSWKLKFNETGKIPAFYNIIPELNHTEMTGFDVQEASQKLSSNFHFIFLKDSQDHPRILKRLEILKKQYQDRGLAVEVIELAGDNRLEKIFSSLILADWFAFYTAEQYGLESEQVPMVEEFKKLMA